MRIFITGASGFIGSHVIRALLKNSHTILALVRKGNPAWRLHDIQGEFDTIQGHLNDRDLLHNELVKFHPEACIHLAWYARPGKYLYSENNISCLFESIQLFELLRSAKCRKIVMAGTCAEYDTDFGYLTEGTPTNPATPYASAKLSCYLVCQQLANSSDIDFTWGRIFFPFGPQENEGRLVPGAICSIIKNKRFNVTSGDHVRDFIFIEDVAEAFCMLLEKESRGVYNISTGMPITVRTLLESIESLMGHCEFLSFDTAQQRSWDPPFICGSNDKLKKLGWKPRHSINQGLLKTIEYWKERLPYPNNLMR